MKPTRTLRLRRESLGELDSGELRQVAGASHLGCPFSDPYCTHGVCGGGTETIAPVRSCLIPCPTRDPQFSCGLC